jgi:UDP:flavonoid glycosyltransferase YjiC (YdhE family)
MGHITRCLAIAGEVLRRDSSAQVTVATEAKWASLIRRVDPQIVLIPQEDHAWHEWDDVDLVRYLLQEEVALLERVQPDIVVHDNRPTVPMACELLGIPNALIAQHHHQPGATVDDPFWTFPSYIQVLKENGIPPFKQDLRELYLRHMILIPSFPELDPWLDRWMNDCVHYVGPLIEEPEFFLVPESISASTYPTIFVYGVLQSAQDFSQLIDAFWDEPFHLLIPEAAHLDLSGRDQSDRLHFSTPSYLPMAAVLPYCAATIIHGGHGVSVTSLMAGVPSVILAGHPGEYERWGNAKALEALGVARTLPGFFQGESVLKEVKSLLQDTSYTENAAIWKERLHRWKGGPSRAYALMQDYVLARTH